MLAFQIMYHHPILKNQKSAAEQACLCGSINCKGILGGSKDSRDAENGFDEEDDLSDEENGDLQLIFGNKKAKKKFHGPRPLRGLDDVSKVQAFSRTLLQKAANVARTKQAIQRILATENTQSLRAFQRYHGLSILKFCFTTHQNNPDIASGVLRAMLKMPVSTRNTIEENGLFDLLRPLRETSNDDYLIMLINDLLNIWESLKLVYKIPKGRSERPISAMLAEEDQQRKDEADNAFISNYQTLYKTVKQSDVPKASPQKQEAANVLPPGWSMAQTEEGLVYYYGMLSQQTQWERPTAPDEVDETPDMARKRKLAALSTNDWAAITAAKEKEMRHEVFYFTFDLITERDYGADGATTGGTYLDEVSVKVQGQDQTRGFQKDCQKG